MKNKEMKRALSKALRKLNEAECAVQEFASYIVFKGFKDGYEPKVGFVSESCVAITRDVKNGELLEMTADEAIILMERQGCITPEVF